MLLSIASVIVRGAVLALRIGNFSYWKKLDWAVKTDGADEDLGLLVHHPF